MPKKEDPESFEVTEYSSGENIYEKYSTIAQIAKDAIRETPNAGCGVAMMGNLMKVFYHAYEMHGPVRMKVIEETGKKYLDEFVKSLKKEYKAKVGKVLDLKEKKELADYTLEKVSLNERYMYTSWRAYEL